MEERLQWRHYNKQKSTCQNLDLIENWAGLLGLVWALEVTGALHPEEHPNTASANIRCPVGVPVDLIH